MVIHLNLIVLIYFRTCNIEEPTFLECLLKPLLLLLLLLLNNMLFCGSQRKVRTNIEGVQLHLSGTYVHVVLDRFCLAFEKEGDLDAWWKWFISSAIRELKGFPVCSI